MKGFPSPLERTVASALLLLSTTTTSLSSPPPPPPPPSKLGVDGEIKYVKEQSDGKSSSEESLRWTSSGSKTCVSSVISDVSSFKEIRSHKLRIVAVVSRCNEMKLKVARKKRTKVNWSSDQKKAAVLALPTSEEASTESGSCLSSTSSVESSARSQYMKMKACHVKPKRSKSRSGSGSAGMRRRAEAILYLLAGGCFSEPRIRELLGDSPDTSKALRMLLKQEEVRRYGTGGRHDPYIYTVVKAGDSNISYSRET